MSFGAEIIQEGYPVVKDDGLETAEFVRVHSIIVDGSDHLGVTSLRFDDHEELVWMGNQCGHVTSYYGPEMNKYTSFQVHDTLHDVRVYQKTGRCLLNLASAELNDMLCALPSGVSTVLFGGHHPQLLEYDIETGQCVRLLKETDGGCALMRRSSQYVCCGNPNGQVFLRDPTTLNVVTTFDAHSGCLSDFDIHGNQLVTCGFSTRPNALTVDRFLKVYDLRMNRSLAPIPVALDPIFLRFVPTFADRICVVSQAGQFQVMEQASIETLPTFHQINNQTSSISAFDISSNYHNLIFGDQAGYLHLFTSTNSGEQYPYNANSIETELAVPVDKSQQPYLPVGNELTSLAYIPMEWPVPNVELFSHWPYDWTERIYRKPVPLDPELLRSIKSGQGINYAPKPKNMKRNQVPYKLKISSKMDDNRRNRTTSVQDDESLVPKSYRKVEIKYSKLGVEDFDFSVHNRTKFAGLEAFTANSYCNVLLQTLYFIDPFRKAIKGHLCSKEHCLSCELGFLFHMQDIQDGNTCQPMNFLRAFRSLPEAAALKIVLSGDDPPLNAVRLIQSFHRFCLTHLHAELVTALREQKFSESSRKRSIAQQVELLKQSSVDENNMELREEDSTIITGLFGSELHNLFTCKCGLESDKDRRSFFFDLTYPNNLGKDTKFSFAEVLKSSVQIEQTTTTWCTNCNKYQPHRQRCLFVKKISDVLALNCHSESQKDYEFWENQHKLLKMESKVDEEQKYNRPACRYGSSCVRRDCKFRHDDRNKASSKFGEEEQGENWLPLRLQIRLIDGELAVNEVRNKDDFKQEEGWITYDLHSSVCYINDHLKGGHFVNHVLIGNSYNLAKEGFNTSQWHLFNDFAITPVDENISTSFGHSWKTPCILYYSRSDIEKHHDIETKNPISYEVLLENTSLVNLDKQKILDFIPLDESEIPKEGDIVGLDAEFVTLNQEEAELRSDGTKSTIKPSHMSVARVTCIRGQGPRVDEPFIDDYISTQEQVVDYLTQFSGIEPGDLNVASSKKHLTTLKSTYLKLRYLIDIGVKFVGHGLKKDFRVINLIVPKDQVIDTVELFYLPRQRMLSLKFLAWFFLGINIQSSVHDSIEDAKTALKLYRKYLELSKDGPEKFKDILQQLYDQGRTLQWKVPEDSAPPALRL